MTIFHGLSAFPLTPTNTEGEVQSASLCRLLERILIAGPDSIGLLGSTGGYAYLSRAQRQHAVQTAVDFVGSRVPIIVGVGALRTNEAQLLAHDAREAGADGLLLAPMSYTPLTDEEVFQHFKAVAEAGKLPLCIYNNPGTTNFTFSHELIVRLAGLPNITAVKMPLPADGDYARELAILRSQLPKAFAIGYSGDWGAADALLAGCDAWYSVVAGLFPAPALALAHAAQTGNSAEVKRINASFQPLWELFKTYGSFRVMYALANSLDLMVSAPPRPVLPIPATENSRIKAALEAMGNQI